MRLVILIFLVSCSLGVDVLAAPRMDAAVGTNSFLLATVVPDHMDPNLFYVFPQASEVVLKADGTQDFLYVEDREYQRRSFEVEGARLTVGIHLTFDSSQLQQKISEIIKQNSKAKFTVITATKTEVLGTSESVPYFVNSNCAEIGGPLEIPVYCTVSIRPELSFGFRKIILNAQAFVFQYVYHFYGVVGGTEKEFAMAVPLKVGSLDRGDYFFDQDGISI